MSTDRSPASLTAHAPSGEFDPANILFDANSVDAVSKVIIVLHEPVRVEVFGLLPGQSVIVEQVIHKEDGTILAAPFSPYDGPLTLSGQRTSVLLEFAGYYRFRAVNVAPGLFTLVAFPFSMSHEFVWTALGPLIPSLVEQLQRVLQGLELKISRVSDNILVKKPDGLYVPKTFVIEGRGIDVSGAGSASDPYVVALENQLQSIIGAETPTIRVVVTQTDPALGPVTATISAVSKVSSREGNLLSADADGLYASRTYLTRGFGTEVEGSGAPGDPYVVSAPCCAKDGEIIGFVCVGPSLADPGVPGGIDSAPTQRQDVVLANPGAQISDIEGSIYITLRDLKQNGGTGGPWLADFSNVRVSAMLYEGLQPRAATVQRRGSVTQIVDSKSVISLEFMLRAGAYDLTKSGWAALRVEAGSYITVTELNGANTRRFYIPYGGEGYVGCGDFKTPQIGYTDSWAILAEASATRPTATIAIAPSTDVPGDIITGGTETQFNDIALETMALRQLRLAVRASNFRESDGVTLDGPYAINFDNVSMNGFFQQTTGGVVDRTANVSRIQGPTNNIPAGPTGMTFTALAISPDAQNYDSNADGFGGGYIAPGSFVLVQNKKGIVTPVFVPSGANGVAAQGSYLAPQGPYEDTFFIRAATTAPPSTEPLDFNLIVAPSTLDASTLTEWTDYFGTANSTPADVTFGFLRLRAATITGGRPPYTVDYSNVEFQGAIRLVSTGAVVGTVGATYAGGLGSSSSAVRTGVQPSDDVYLRLDPLLLPSHVFNNQNDYGVTFKMRGFIIVKDSGLGADRKQRIYYVPAGKNDGNLIPPDTQLGVDPSPGNFYSESYSYRGYIPPVAPIVGRVCISPTVAVPLNGVVGQTNVAIPFGATVFPPEGEPELRIYINSLVGPSGTQFSAELINTDGGEPFVVGLSNNVNGVVTQREALVQRVDSSATSGSFSGSATDVYFAAKLVAGTGANKYDLTKNGDAFIGIRPNTFIRVVNGGTVVNLPVPGGTELTAACNGAPGPFTDAFTIVGSDNAPNPNVSAKLAIAPSLGAPISGAVELTSPVVGPTTGGTGAEAMKPLSLVVQDIVGGTPPYTVDFSGVSARVVSSVAYNVDSPLLVVCNNNGTPGGGGGGSTPLPPATQADIVIQSTEFCGRNRFGVKRDGTFYAENKDSYFENVVFPQQTGKWHKDAGVPFIALEGKYEVKATIQSGAIDTGSPLSATGSSAVDTWLRIPYDFPTLPPNQSVNPSWRAATGTKELTIGLEFRAVGSTLVLGTATMRLNLDPAVNCSLDSGGSNPGGGTGTGDGTVPGDTDPPLAGDNRPPNEPVRFAPYAITPVGDDNLLEFEPQNNVITGVTGTATRVFRPRVRTCATWSDSAVVDISLELSGFVLITDSNARSFTLWVPSATEGLVGITQEMADPGGFYADAYRYKSPNYTGDTIYPTVAGVESWVQTPQVEQAVAKIVIFGGAHPTHPGKVSFDTQVPRGDPLVTTYVPWVQPGAAAPAGVYTVDASDVIPGVVVSGTTLADNGTVELTLTAVGTAGPTGGVFLSSQGVIVIKRNGVAVCQIAALFRADSRGLIT
jgi:hypothetical protein